MAPDPADPKSHFFSRAPIQPEHDVFQPEDLWIFDIFTEVTHLLQPDDSSASNK